MDPTSSGAMRVVVSYSHLDEALSGELGEHLSLLVRSRRIDVRHDRRIEAGVSPNSPTESALGWADIILLLVSPDFLRSDYCRGIEVCRALKRRERGDVAIIPVIVRPCEWREAPFGSLPAVPRGGRPLTLWTSRNEAFLDVVRAVRRLLPDNSRQPFEAQTRDGRTAVERIPENSPLAPSEGAEAIEDQAADWVIRLEGSVEDSHQWDTFEDWCAASPKNWAAFLRIQAAWRRADVVRNIRPLGDDTVDPDLTTKWWSMPQGGGAWGNPLDPQENGESSSGSKKPKRRRFWFKDPDDE